MCINQKIIVNRHYIKAVKSLPGCSNLLPSQLNDKAQDIFKHAPDLFIPVDCGRCLPCQKKRSNYWRQRLVDEFTYLVKRDPDLKYRVYFVTLTIAPQYYKRDLTFAYSLIKHFRERYRKRYGRSLRYWITSEYGEKRGRLHFHGIFFNPICDASQLMSLWQYGRCDMSVVGYSPKNLEHDPEKGIIYVTKYITKNVDKWFINWSDRSRIWCSPGLGLEYCLDPAARQFHDHHNDPLFFRVTNRFPVALPRYYLSKLFSPLDNYKRSLSSMSRFHQLPPPPYVVGKHKFDDLVSYMSFLRSIGGRLNLLASQYVHLSPYEKQLYHGQ